jgi:hypothetical protein
MPLAPAGRIGLHDHDDQVGIDPVRDDGLRPVDDVTVAVAYGGGRHGGEVGAGARLGHRDRSDDLAADQAWEPPVGLLLGRELLKVGDAGVVVQAESKAGCVDAGPLDLLAASRS